MFNWLFRRKRPVFKPAPKKRGFFSTDDDFVFDRNLADEQNIERALPRTFQRSLKDMKITTRNGDLEVTTAMDEAYPGLQQQKLQNNLGGYLPAQVMCWYASQGFIGYQTAALLAQNWLVNKACTVPARDAVRHGYEITINDGTDVDPDDIELIKRGDKKYKVKDNLVSFLRMGRIFGIRILLFEVKSRDPLYYEKPFNIDGVTPGSYVGMSQIDPYWITPELDMQAAANPSSQHFYEPTYWFVSGRRIHRTHLVIFKNYGELPDILKPTYFYGGIPLPQLIYERVYAAERTANEAPMLAMSKRLTVLNTDITQAVANQAAFVEKMAFWSMLQNNFGIKVVGEAEEINQFDTSLTDMDAVIMTQYQLVAAIAETPATKLLGTSPKGFGASGEYEESSYHEMLESLQEHDLSPALDRHHLIMMKSDIEPKIGKSFRIDHQWRPTDTPTAKEQAEIELIKAQTDNQYVQAGSIDGTDSRTRLIEDPDSGYNGFPEVVPGGPGDREAQQAAEKALEQPVQQKAGKTAGADSADVPMGSIGGGFDPISGLLNGARLVTGQRFLDEPKVEEKIQSKDFEVHVSPEFLDDGKKYRTIIDGHHSLAAAMKAKVMPVFIEKLPRDVVFNAATRKATDAK